MLKKLVLVIALLAPSALYAAPMGPAASAASAASASASLHQSARVRVVQSNRARFILLSKLSPAKGAEVQKGDILF